MKSNGNVVTVEIDGEQNERLYFQPLQRTVRGTFDARRLSDPGKLVREWPEPIPSQRLHLDLKDGRAWLTEPLHDDEHASIRERIEDRGMRLPPESEEFQGVHTPTWIFWLKRAVDSGKARVVHGTLPDDPGGEPRTSFITHRPDDPMERMASGFDRLASAMEKQTEAIAKLLQDK